MHLEANDEKIRDLVGLDSNVLLKGLGGHQIMVPLLVAQFNRLAEDLLGRPTPVPAYRL
jgi:hypothetical protein